MRLLIVRHGATANNAEARYTGQSDVPLSPLGTRQVEAVGRALASVRLDAIIASDLVRARSTAEAIARHHQVPIVLDPDLREISIGAWEGLTYAEALRRDPTLVTAWQSGRPESLLVAPPGGETNIAFRDRLARALDRWQAAYPRPDDTVLWVTHGGVIGVLLCYLLGMDLTRRWQFRKDNAAITELEIGDGQVHSDTESSAGIPYAIVMRQNDTCHLAGVTSGDEREEKQVL
jgi:broad specificity phosphatase PhoE